ncbi:hypothetical protein BJ980_003690 [Nocardioides daedukensis]|uniref:Uncharacterized protein n=1 Tax=Nocardioides daedukensis TaxID=634462 RepID=A0A7Y9S556_9ACTN|nr:hypothetical protein [Nocardioides daedukensis]NYG60767.1 hypothetical protein [Nocardioides daedukensis]
MPTTPQLAEQLLDAQVRFHIARLSGEHLTTTVESLAEDVFSAGSSHQVADLLDRDAVKVIVARALTTVPSSAAVSGFVELAVDIALEGPGSPYPLGDLVEREQVEVLVDQALGLTPVLERALDRLTASPLVGTLATRFMGRIVNEVLQANKAMADKVPGLGGLVSLGTSAASRVTGAAGKQFEGILGDTVGKGGTYAVRRLNRIIVETLQDPTTREAILQVWDLAAAEPVQGLGERIDRDELSGVVDAVHEIVISAAANQHVIDIGNVVVDAFFERFGGYTPTELLDELDLRREDIVADLVRIAPGVVGALAESGDLDRILRNQLAPFYASDEVAALLG